MLELFKVSRNGVFMEFHHIPIMLEQVIENLNIKEDGIYVDGTIGGGGHSKEILKYLTTGKLIGIDRDQDAIDTIKKRFQKEIEENKLILVKDNHDNIKNILEDMHIDLVDGIFLDLGVSSFQLDEKQRGFSYLGSNTLDMRMDKSQTLDAKYILNNYSESELVTILKKYGEERFAKKIANNIIEFRKIHLIKTTDQLVDIIDKSIPAKFKQNGHPAKKTFQALRIEVNNELEPLENTIRTSIELLKDGGRLAVITFHSLEDAATKRVMKDMQEDCICPKELPYCVCNKKSFGKIITKKPILPSNEEQLKNSRSKSAKLRVFERIIKK